MSQFCFKQLQISLLLDDILSCVKSFSIQDKFVAIKNGVKIDWK